MLGVHRLARGAQVTALAIALMGTSVTLMGAPASNAYGTCATPAPSFSAGDGSSESPYQIGSTAELMLLQSTTSDLDKHFILANDLDLESCQWNGGIGSVASPFTGTFDGDGHTIANLNVSVSDIANGGAAGLFGTLDNGAVVKDLNATGTVSADISAEGASAYAGGIAGKAGASTIQGSTFRGTVRSTATGNHPYAGGLVGSGSFTRIVSSGAAVTVSASPSGRPGAGGIAGVYEGNNTTPATITDSWAVGQVFADGDAQSSAGGLVGVGVGIAISGSFTNADVRTGTLGHEPAAGGLLGYGIADISNSFSRSNVNGGRFTGGLVGWLRQQDGFDTLENSYAQGTLVQGGMGDGGKGGLVGFAQWNAPLTAMQTQGAVWDTTTSGTTQAAGRTDPAIDPVPVDGATGVDTPAMKALSTFSGLSWSIASNRDSSSVWGICANYNEGLPFLTAPFTSNVCASPAPATAISPSAQTFSGASGAAVSLPAYSASGFLSDPVFSITPSLGDGVSMNPTTGAITGSVGVTSAATYTVTARSGPYLQTASATVTQDASAASVLSGQATTFLTPSDNNGAFQAIASRPDGSSLVVSYGVQADGGTTTGILVAALLDPNGTRLSVTRIGGDADLIGTGSQPSVAYNPITGGWITCFARLVDIAADPQTSQPMCQYLDAGGAPSGTAFAVDDVYADRWNQNAIAYSTEREQFLVLSTAWSTGAVGRWVSGDGSGVVGDRIPYGVGTTPAVTGQGGVGVDVAYSELSDTFAMVMRGKTSGVNQPAPWVFMLNGDGQPLAGASNPVRIGDDLAQGYSNGSIAYSQDTDEFIAVAFLSDSSYALATRTFEAATGTPSASETRSELPGTFDPSRWRPVVAADQAGGGYVIPAALKTVAESSVIKVFMIPLRADGVAGEPVLLAGSATEPTGSRPRITYRDAYCDFVVSYQLDSSTWGRQAFVHRAPGSAPCSPPSPAPTPAPSPGGGGNSGGSGSNGSQTATPSTTVASTPQPGGNATPTGAAVSLPVYRQPAVAQQVSGTVTLVPARVAEATPARTMRQEPSATIGSAPIVAAVVNQPVKLLVPGLTPGTAYVVQLKSGKSYEVLGSVKANSDGQLQLPVFRTTKPTETTIAIVAPSGKASYVKVSASKAGAKKAGVGRSGAKATSGSGGKPAQGSGARR